MNIDEFFVKIDRLGFGANINTYHQDGVNHVFFLITERGEEGTFIKRECLDHESADMMDTIIAELEKKIIIAELEKKIKR